MDVQENFWSALFITTLSGLSTAIGGIIVLLIGEPSKKSLGIMLSFSSGVMIYISFLDLMPDAIQEIGYFYGNIWFFIGIFTFTIIEYIVPEPDPKHWVKDQKSKSVDGKIIEKDLLLAGIYTALGISLHNFPEGIAVYLASLKGMNIGIPLAFAIAVHNIPEGMAVAAPLWSATRSKWTALKWCTISGMCEPIAALIVGMFFTQYLTNFIIQCSLAFVAGIMVSICLQELHPQALKCVTPAVASLSATIGMGVIFISVDYLHTLLGRK